MQQISIQDIVLPTSLPLTVEQLLESTWTGTAVWPSGFVMATIMESGDDPGYFHASVITNIESFKTKKPMYGISVGLFIDACLDPYGQSCDQLRWKVDEVIPHSTPAHRATPVGEIVYFLRAGDFIKIGKATGSPGSRVTSFKTGCPFPIEVIGTMPGGLKEEHELHVRFASIRAHGEWFHATKELQDFVQEALGESA